MALLCGLARGWWNEQVVVVDAKTLVVMMRMALLRLELWLSLNGVQRSMLGFGT